MIVDEILVFDTETTGVDPETARIVSAYIGRMRRGGEIIDFDQWLLDPGIEIPDAATAIHGITTEHARNEGQNAADALIEIEGTLAAAQIDGIPIVIMNAAYDLTLLEREIGRHFDRPMSFEPRPVLDPYVLDKAIDTYRKGGRKLVDLAPAYGVRLASDDAHAADFDAIAAGRIILAILAGPPTNRTRADVLGKWETVAAASPSDLHRWQTTWRARQQESLADYFERTDGDRSRADTVDGSWPMIPRSTT